MLDKSSVPAHPTNLDNRQGPVVLAVGAGVGFLSSIFSFFFLPLWETAQYRLKYCLKYCLLNPKQPINF